MDANAYIVKYGLAKKTEERTKGLSTGTSPFNNFNMQYIYDIYEDLALPTEIFVHQLFSPLSAKIKNKTSKEFFMVHHQFMNHIALDFNKRVKLYCDYINDYIDILQSHQFNYELAENDVNELCKNADLIPIIDNTKDSENMDRNNEIREDNIIIGSDDANDIADNKDQENVVLIKCGRCRKEKPSDQFRFKNNGELFKSCIACCDYKNNQKNKSKEEIKPKQPKEIHEIDGRKMCSKCTVVKPLEEYYVKDDGKRYTVCIKCVDKKHTKRLKELKEEVQKTFDEITPKNEKEVEKLKTLQDLLNNVTKEEVYQKKRINQLGSYVRCNNNLTHIIDSLEAWVNETEICNYMCKNCFREMRKKEYHDKKEN